jgi:hypothetical protein
MGLPCDDGRGGWGDAGRELGAGLRRSARKAIASLVVVLSLVGEKRDGERAFSEGSSSCAVAGRGSSGQGRVGGAREQEDGRAREKGGAAAQRVGGLQVEVVTPPHQLSSTLALLRGGRFRHAHHHGDSRGSHQRISATISRRARGSCNTVRRPCW